MERQEKRVIDAKTRAWHQRLIGAYKKDRSKWSCERNEAAYDIYVSRAKLFARARGLKEPVVIMPQERGFPQVPGSASPRPFVIEHKQVSQMHRFLKRNKLR